MQEVFEAKPDGYTLLSNLETRNIQSELAFQSPYKILEFTPIICLTKVDLLIVARKDAPFNNLSELKALSKKKIINANFVGGDAAVVQVKSDRKRPTLGADLSRCARYFAFEFGNESAHLSDRAPQGIDAGAPDA